MRTLCTTCARGDLRGGVVARARDEELVEQVGHALLEHAVQVPVVLELEVSTTAHAP